MYCRNVTFTKQIVRQFANTKKCHGRGQDDNCNEKTSLAVSTFKNNPESRADKCARTKIKNVRTFYPKEEVGKGSGDSVREAALSIFVGAFTRSTFDLALLFSIRRIVYCLHLNPGLLPFLVHQLVSKMRPCLDQIRERSSSVTN